MANSYLFSNSNPTFLDLLDSDPGLAMQQFENGFKAFFDSVPPRLLQRLDPQTREDMIATLRVHCLSEDFRILRRYKDIGKPFSHWFTLVAHNRFLELLRGTKHERSLNDFVRDGSTVEPEGKHALPDRLTFERELLAFTRQCLKEATAKCRRLLLLAAEECTPIELALLMNVNSNQNKKISDDLRYCRNRLFKCLASKGITADDRL